MMPPEPQQSPAPEATHGPVAVPARLPVYTWYHKVGAFLFITFCMLLGLFLLIFPWTDWWGDNYFSNLLPRMEPWWDNMYLRGAVSGLGVANLYISFAETFRLKRFDGR
jgi:hypothetical protein